MLSDTPCPRCGAVPRVVARELLVELPSLRTRVAEQAVEIEVLTQKLQSLGSRAIYGPKPKSRAAAPSAKSAPPFPSS